MKNMHTSVEDRQQVGDQEQHSEPASLISLHTLRKASAFASLLLRDIPRGSCYLGHLLGSLIPQHPVLSLVSVWMNQNKAHLILPYVKEVILLRHIVNQV